MKYDKRSKTILDTWDKKRLPGLIFNTVFTLIEPAGSITFALKFGASSVRGRVILEGGLYFNVTNF